MVTALAGEQLDPATPVNYCTKYRYFEIYIRNDLFRKSQALYYYIVIISVTLARYFGPVVSLTAENSISIVMAKRPPPKQYNKIEGQNTP